MFNRQTVDETLLRLAHINETYRDCLRCGQSFPTRIDNSHLCESCYNYIDKIAKSR